MDDLKEMLKNKLELHISGGSAVSFLLKAYELYNDSLILKTRDQQGNYAYPYEIYDFLTIGNAFKKTHQALDVHIPTKETFKGNHPKIKPIFVFGVPLLIQKLSQRIEVKLTSILESFFKEPDPMSPTFENKGFKSL